MVRSTETAIATDNCVTVEHEAAEVDVPKQGAVPGKWVDRYNAAHCLYYRFAFARTVLVYA